MFVAQEDFVGITKNKQLHVADLHKNEKGKYWPHDCIAIACYLCEKCFEPNTLINQA